MKTCNGCGGNVQKNPNKNDYSHYAYYCPSCDTFLFERQTSEATVSFDEVKNLREVEE